MIFFKDVNVPFNRLDVLWIEMSDRFLLWRTQSVRD